MILFNYQRLKIIIQCINLVLVKTINELHYRLRNPKRTYLFLDTNELRLLKIFTD